MAASLAAAVIAGVLLHLLWNHWGLPDHPLGLGGSGARPQGLAAFVALALPAAALLPSLALGGLMLLLPRKDSPDQRRLCGRLLRLDAGSYLILPVFLLLPPLWRYLGNGFMALGLCFLGMVTLKAGILLAFLWQGFLRSAVRSGAGLGLKGHAAVFLVVLTLLGLAAAWTNQAVSTASDEVGYLTMAHGLWEHGDLEAVETVRNQEYKSYYWARWSDKLAFGRQKARGVLFPYLIAPFYGLGGRLGVLLFFAALMGLLAGQLLAWLDRAGLKPGPAAAAVGLVLASAPVLIASRQVFPDVAAMLLLAIGLRLLAALEARPWSAGLGLLLVAALMALVKVRLGLLGAGLILAGALDLAAARLGWRRALALALAGALGLGVAAWLGYPEYWPRAAAAPLAQALEQIKRYAASPWDPVLIFIRGVAVDQNYGVLPAAPIFLLALAGVPAALRFRRRISLHVLLPTLLYLAVICLTRWQQWYGGFSGPGRFVAVLLPGAALFLGLCLQALNRPWRRLLALVPAAFGLAYAWLLTLLAQFHYSRSNGVNNLVGALERNLGFSVHHLLPSTFAYSPALNPSLGLAAVAVAALAVVAWRETARAPAPAPGGDQPGGVSLNEWLSLGLICGLAGGGLLLAAALTPPAWLEAEQMEHRGGALWAEWAYPPPHMRGWVMFNGTALEGSLFFPGGPARVRVIARGDLRGRLTLSVGGRARQAPWPGGRFAHTVAFDLGDMARGVHRLRLDLQTCPNRSCSLLVDRLELVAGGPARKEKP